ncbi:hypothetical protein [Peribacillus kribbensis]|uniref:hypothetical protein n=1 Tax=Peribacillus kribbensis TaxID=356658 RepID=UPI0003F9DC46|nr:hypothetical protein [Peribacillus kribbensis]
MKSRINLKEQKLNHALLMFVLPFSFKNNVIKPLREDLKKQGYEWFELDKLSLEKSYYGDFSVSHENIESYYLPFTNKILFPASKEHEGFHRYSKPLNTNCYFKAEHFSLPFKLLSTDITICPFNVGFLTLRLQVGEEDFAAAVEFTKRFRSLNSRRNINHEIEIEGEAAIYKEVEEFIFDFVNPSIPQYMDHKNMEESYFETFPFFEDDRMYVQSIFALKGEEKIDKIEAFRAANLDGLDKNGFPEISSSSGEYINDFLEENSYKRWEPDTYYVVKEDHFSCVTNEQGESLEGWVSQMFGEHYYGLLLNLFHKIVLLKIANDYSEIRIERDKEKVEELIYIVNAFTANYYFVELAAESQGRDLFLHLREEFKVDQMYSDGKETLESLYRYQEGFNDKKDSLLLLYLTLFTVISGIYGMNQVIDDFKGNIHWNKVLHYNLFEYIALFVAVSGMVVSIYLTISNFLSWRNDRKKRELWEERTAVSRRR